ncbi:hypothetical protein AA0120_g6661 [Alternaria tenuissima]|nr:hypothetical protein AA0120_g6661 [Alternaria tenuissima]
MSKPYDQGAPPAYPPPTHQDAGPAPGGMQPSYYNQGGGAPDYYGGSPNPYQQGPPQGQYGPPQGQYGPPQGQYGYGGQQMQYQQGPPPPGGYYQDDRRADGGGGGLFAGLDLRSKTVCHDPKSSSSKLGVCPATPSQFAVQSFTAMRDLGIKWNAYDYACLASDSDVPSDFTSSIITSQSPTLLALR